MLTYDICTEEDVSPEADDRTDRLRDHDNDKGAGVKIPKTSRSRMYVCPLAAGCNATVTGRGGLNLANGWMDMMRASRDDYRICSVRCGIV